MKLNVVVLAALAAAVCCVSLVGAAAAEGRQPRPAVLPVAAPFLQQQQQVAPSSKAEKNPIDELVAIILQGVESILQSAAANLDQAMVVIQTVVITLQDMLAEGINPLQFLAEMISHAVQVLFEELEGLIGITIPLRQDLWDALIIIIGTTLEDLLEMAAGDLDLALQIVQELIDGVNEMQEPDLQQLIDMALQSLDSLLSQVQDLIEGNGKLTVVLNNRDVWDDLLIMVQEGLDGILSLVEGNLEEALVLVQNMLDMILELQAQSPEEWQQQLIDMALQSLGTILGQIEDLLGITPFHAGRRIQVYQVLDRNHVRKTLEFAVAKGSNDSPIFHKIQKDVWDDLLALIEQGLDGILAMVEGNLEEALILVQNMVDMLQELQAQSPEDWEQQLIDMALQSLGTILGQIEDLLGITP